MPKWAKLNEMLGALSMPRLEILDDRGVSEASVIMTIYNLLKDNQSLRKKVEIGDFGEVQRLEKEVETTITVNVKLEQSVFVSL